MAAAVRAHVSRRSIGGEFIAGSRVRWRRRLEVAFARTLAVPKTRYDGRFCLLPPSPHWILAAAGEMGGWVERDTFNAFRLTRQSRAVCVWAPSRYLGSVKAISGATTTRAVTRRGVRPRYVRARFFSVYRRVPPPPHNDDVRKTNNTKRLIPQDEFPRQGATNE